MVGVSITKLERQNSDQSCTEVANVFEAVTLNDGATWVVRPTATMPSPGHYRLTYRQEWYGYDNSPHLNVVELEIDDPLPRAGTISSPSERTVQLRKKDDSPYLLISQTVDASDEIEVTLDYSPPDDPLFDTGEHIDFVVGHAITPEAGALGYSLALGSRRTKLDLPNDKLSYIMVPDPAFASNAAFNGDGVPVLAETTIKTTVPEGQDYHIYQRKTGARRKQK